MEQQNLTLDYILLSIERVNKMIGAHMSNFSNAFERLKEDEKHYILTQNRTGATLNDLLNITMRGVRFEKEIKEKVYAQVDEMSRLRNTLRTIYENTTILNNLFQGANDANLEHYNEKTNELKLSIAQMEYKVLQWITMNIKKTDSDQADEGRELNIMKRGW